MVICKAGSAEDNEEDPWTMLGHHQLSNTSEGDLNSMYV